jgi:hypothetical protein
VEFGAYSDGENAATITLCSLLRWTTTEGTTMVMVSWNEATEKVVG